MYRKNIFINLKIIIKSSTGKIKNHLVKTVKLSFATALGLFLLTSCGSGSEKGSTSDSLAGKTKKDRVAGSDMNTKSYQKNAMAKPLVKPMMEWFVKNYLNNMAEAKDPRISLVNANLKGLPSTTIITDEIDPLQSAIVNCLLIN
ncbi:alpha/beta hydrolase fold domain-containing protein [Dyadobacter frigoris]|uniref:alpha/beta hydrolase fold domain-containing protein n=1 Tax=Dyadobacter frigoris TaxID=2576211 RepID=UPI001C6FDE06|nr:alpha/beta hydrolase fold domain-containing protein [Dyadobacter frigoris]GLU51444.1 hypothetical protein Dfri01_09050 [Dyadobacter frigoris]